MDRVPGQTNYLMEKRLRECDPGLHRRFTDTVITMQNALFRFRRLFPEFTDHSALHSMTVIDFCNRLIGPEQMQLLNADAIYVLLMSCYLHDVGMGISEEQFREFSKEIDFGDYPEKHPQAGIPAIVRDFHQEFSAAFVRKYADLLEIPTSEHAFAIVQVCRGHRKTDLFDTGQFPPDFAVPGGHEIFLPYLSALIRLADEIDVMAARNPKMLYDMESFTDDHEIAYHKRHLAVKDLLVTDDAFTMQVVRADPKTNAMVDDLAGKMQKTLDLCRAAAEAGSPFQIRQKQVNMVVMGRESI